MGFLQEEVFVVIDLNQRNNEMISKELLSELLSTVSRIDYIDNSYGPEVIAWRGLSNEGNICTGSMEIYELAHKCKEWALKNYNLELISATTEDGAYCTIDNIIPVEKLYDMDELYVSTRIEYESIIFDSSLEPEAIFKACEWIMEQIK